jgi:biopolymer transport protein ExbB
MRTSLFISHRNRYLAVLSLAFLTVLASDSYGWWNKDWSARKKFTVDASAQGVEIADPIGTATVLIRLHDGNFQFGVGKDDGSDLRFVSADDKTVLPHQIEKFDGLMHEAFVWVQVPDIKPGQATPFFLYYGNLEGGGEAADFKKTYDAETALAYHFAEKGSAPVDSSQNGNAAENAGTPSEGSMIGAGLRLLGQGPITIPPSETLNFFAGDPLTFSAWIKPGAPKPNAALYSRSEGGNGIVIGLDQGKPYVEISAGGTPQRATATEAIAADAWKHLAVISADGKTTLYVDGESVGSVDAGLPELKGVATLGGTSAAFVGEIDQLEISKAARGAGFLKLAAVSQSGTDKAAKLLVAGEDEGSEGGGGHNEALEHVMLFGDIAKNMMFDGWLVVFACAIMALVSWFVAIRKFFYLNKSAKGDEVFLKQWKEVATDLTALDHADKDNVRSLGGKVDARTQKQLATSPIYHIYHVGSEEIHHRQRSKNGFQGLSARSIQAIRASLDAGMQRELHRLHSGLVFLTISIAGGPYVGLLGTVMGVMITFAVIAKTGEVEVNSIAPGIASALLATVAGLLVAIPALFIYSYLNSRIKNSASAMQMFIDEFVAKMAEFYPTPSDLPGGRASFAEVLPTNAEGAVTGSPR